MYEDPAFAARALAEMIAAEIRGRLADGRRLVLGLPTGSTPVRVYEELIRRHREEGLSFSEVLSFNLDEYYGLGPEDSNSYHEFMREMFFSKVDLPSAQAHLPDGLVPRAEVARHCADYEARIEEAGGIDLQLLGVGRSGHIGFNEPPAEAESRTRLVTLDPVTRMDAAPAFGGVDKVPDEAITMGVSTILRARRIVLLAFGASKAEIVRRALSEKPSPDLPASFLQQHPKVTFMLDRAAAAELKSLEGNECN